MRASKMHRLLPLAFWRNQHLRELKEILPLKIEIPNMLSYMAFMDANKFVPGIKDLINGNPNMK